MTSSPLRPGASQEESLDWYKRQYEQLETDLADFQASSKELEEQLERDIETAEKNERRLKEQVERLGFEVDEWKSKHKQAKAEANNAQNTLQKEITSIRDQHRTLQLTLRDIEVANDDYERQARNTTSSLEDLESRLNVSIERGVLLEEEVKNGDTEREALRIENQRLRDELGDLKVESEITLEKLRLSGKTIETLRTRKPGNLAVRNLRAMSPGSEASGRTSSPTMSTPPPRSDVSEMPTPPSPPLSDEAAAPHAQNGPKTPGRRTSLIPDAGATPRPSAYGARGTVRHSRGPSLASSAGNTAADIRAMRAPPRSKPVVSPNTTARLPRSESLHQMKSLRIRMQKIEERVQSARSKLPAPRDTTPKASPRAGEIPSSITVRRTSKRESSVNQSSDQSIETPGRRESQIHGKRLSFGIPRPASRASAVGERPPSRMSTLDRPPSAAGRPISRLSMSGARPASRAGTHEESSRPQSSLSSAHSTTSRTPRTHRPSASVSELRRRAVEGEETPQAPKYGLGRRTTLDRSGMHTASSLARRQSQGLSTKTAGRRTSVPSAHDGLMRPPPLKSSMSNIRKDVHGYEDTDLGETY